MQWYREALTADFVLSKQLRADAHLIIKGNQI